MLQIACWWLAFAAAGEPDPADVVDPVEDDVDESVLVDDATDPSGGGEPEPSPPPTLPEDQRPSARLTVEQSFRDRGVEIGTR